MQWLLIVVWLHVASGAITTNEIYLPAGHDMESCNSVGRMLFNLVNMTDEKNRIVHVRCIDIAPPQGKPT